IAGSVDGAGIAVSIVVDVIDKDVTASIDDHANVWAGNSVTVQALSSEKLFELAVGGGASGSSAAVTGSFVVLVLNKAGSHSTSAFIGDATVHSGGQTHVKASDDEDKVEAYAGNISISGGSAAVGVGVTVVVRQGTVNAYTTDGANLTVGSLLVEAIENLNLIAVGGAGAGGESAGIAGSVVVDVNTDSTTATLDGTTHASGNVAVSASDTTNIISVAGQLAIGGTAGVGVGVDVEVLSKTTTAEVAAGATVTTTGGGNVTVDSTSSENVLSIAAGLAVAGSASVAVNANVTVYHINTYAYIGDGGTSGDFATVTADGSVRVGADEMLTLNVIAGNIAVGGAAGVGVAAAVPVIFKTTIGRIGSYAQVNGKGNNSDGGLTVNTGQYTVTPTDTRFDGSGVSGNTINTGIDLGFQTGDSVTYDPGDGTAIGGLATHTVYYVIRVDATHVKLATSLDNAKNGVAIALTPGFGVSHRLIGTDQAQAPNDDSHRFAPSSAVNSAANTITLPYVLGLSDGDAVVYGAGGDSPIGGLTDGTTYYLLGDTENGSGTPQAFQLAATKGGAAIDISNAGITGKSHSLVKEGNMPSADANDSAPHTVTQSTQSGFYGVAVTASNSDDINSVSFGVAIGGSAGVSVDGNVNVITIDTQATVADHAQVNQTTTGANANQNLLVASGNQFHLLLVTAALAIGGGAGVGVGVNVGVLSIHSTALIDSFAHVRAQHDAVVSSNQQETLVAVTFSGGGGTVGVAGAIGVIVLNTQSYAETAGNAQVIAGNNAAFLSADDTKVTGFTGGAAGGFVGVGVGVYVLVITKDTKSLVAGTSSVTANNAGGGSALGGISDGTVGGSGFGFGSLRGLAIQARSSEDIFGIVVAVGAGFVGVSVPVGVTVLSATTTADLAGTATATLDVNISALDSMKTITVAGGIAGGFVGVGAGVDIGVANNTTEAKVDSTGTITTARNVAINALSKKDITTYTLAFAGGFVGVGAAVAVWSIGTSDSSYDDGQGDSGNGLSEERGGDPAGQADSKATDSGPGTYSNILSGTTSSSSTWTSGTTYKSGQSVVDSFNGKHYVATVGSPNTTLAPHANLSQWRLAETDSTISGLISSNGTTTANSQIASHKPTGTPTQTALSTPDTPGTNAKLLGHVTATGNVTLNADDDVHFGGVVGAAGGGAVGIGASILVASITAQTKAEVGGTVSSGGLLTVHASMQEDTSTIAFAGAGGAIGVAAQVAVLNDHSTQTAVIDDSAVVHRAAGGIDVNAENNRSVASLTIGGAFGAVAAGVAIGVVILDGSTSASIGDATIGDTGTVTNITVESHDRSVGNSEAIAVTAGIGVALAGAVAIAHVNAGSTASIDGSASINATGALQVTADAQPQAIADAIGVAVAGGAGLGVAWAEAHADGSVSASISDGADFTVGSVSVTASRLAPTDLNDRNAKANAVAGGGGILLGASGAIAKASSTASVTASLGKNFQLPNGDVSVAANGSSRNRADATGVAIGFIGIGAADATAKSDLTTSATIDTGLNPNVGRTGALSLQATGLNET
ncbi:MAG: hypothetical protein ABUS54_03040, partial [Actinomycetota bacterium]